MAWGGSGGQVDNIRKTGKSTTQRAAEASRASGPGFIEQIDITSNQNKSKTVSVVNGTVNLMYYESLLQDHIAAEVTFVDSGGAIDNDTVLSGLPLVGEENVQLKFSDNQGNTLVFNNKNNNSFYVGDHTPIGDDSTKSSVNLQLITREAIKNGKTGVEIRLDGKISEHVERLLTDKEYLATEKDLTIEETTNNVNYTGAKSKPYFLINKMSKDAIPSGESNPNATNNSAGFLFYETAEGFYFKSIDGLMGKPQKLKVIYNNTPGSGGKDIPAGYDVKALSYSKGSSLNIIKKLKYGAGNTKIVTFNHINMDYEVSSLSAAEKEQYLELAGKALPVFNDEFNSGEENKNFSRTTFMVKDTGTLPTGTGLGEDQQQLTKSKEVNYDPNTITNQSIMRYNQMFSSTVTIVIPGDLSLHAGDSIWVDTVELKQTANKACEDEVNKKDGGKYVIATMCHYLTPRETYTKLILIRDSVGRTTPTRSRSETRKEDPGKYWNDRRKWRGGGPRNKYGQNVKTSDTATTTDWSARRKARRGR